MYVNLADAVHARVFIPTQLYVFGNGALMFKDWLSAIQRSNLHVL